MIRALSILILSSVLAIACTECSSPHVFPRLKPLFVGLDESALSQASKNKLTHAKVDFQCARKGEPPRFASDAGGIRHTRSRRFIGDGYEIIIVDASAGFVRRTGPEITIASCITGGKPYHYDEIEICDD